MKPWNRYPKAVLGLAIATAMAGISARAADPFFIHDTVDQGVLTPIFQPPLQLGSFSIAINALPGLSGNAAALAAFQRAANQWEAFISDPVTVNINGNMEDLGSGSIIGSTSVTTYTIPISDYSSFCSQMISDESFESRVNPIISSLPASPLFDVPAGFSVGGISASRATWSALGYSFPPQYKNDIEAVIIFNSTFSFDYDNSNGVPSGYMDFETVAAHEIGHALGFVSEVDIAAYYLSKGTTGPLYPTPLDLYRFRDLAENNPSTAAEFASYGRTLVPGEAAHTDQIFVTSGQPAEIEMETGVGLQASHWKDNLGIGLMDPTLNYREIVPISGADLLALDLIGWNAVPEPADYALVFGCASLGLAWATRKSRKQA